MENNKIKRIKKWLVYEYPACTFEVDDLGRIKISEGFIPYLHGLTKFIDNIGQHMYFRNGKIVIH